MGNYKERGRRRHGVATLVGERGGRKVAVDLVGAERGGGSWRQGQAKAVNVEWGLQEAMEAPYGRLPASARCNMKRLQGKVGKKN